MMIMESKRRQLILFCQKFYCTKQFHQILLSSEKVAAVQDRNFQNNININQSVIWAKDIGHHKNDVQAYKTILAGFVFVVQLEQKKSEFDFSCSHIRTVCLVDSKYLCCIYSWSQVLSGKCICGHFCLLLIFT